MSQHHSGRIYCTAITYARLPVSLIDLSSSSITGESLAKGPSCSAKNDFSPSEIVSSAIRSSSCSFSEVLGPLVLTRAQSVDYCMLLRCVPQPAGSSAAALNLAVKQDGCLFMVGLA